MNSDRVYIIVICEDVGHKSFVINFLKNLGFTERNYRILDKKTGGDGYQFICSQLSVEFPEYIRNRNRVKQCLIAFTDAEPKKISAEDRVKDMSKHFERSRDDKVLYIVSKRCVETWVHYLIGEEASEDEEKRHHTGAHTKTKEAVYRLNRICTNQEPTPGNFLPSLQLACKEFKERFPE